MKHQLLINILCGLIIATALAYILYYSITQTNFH